MITEERFQKASLYNCTSLEDTVTVLTYGQLAEYLSRTAVVVVEEVFTTGALV